MKHQRFYRVRMVCGKWYVYIYEQGRIVERQGPFSFAEAMPAAKASGALDMDRHLERLDKAETAQ